MILKINTYNIRSRYDMGIKETREPIFFIAFCLTLIVLPSTTNGQIITDTTRAKISPIAGDSTFAYEIKKQKYKDYTYDLIFYNTQTNAILKTINSSALNNQSDFFNLSYPKISLPKSTSVVYNLTGISQQENLKILSSIKINPFYEGWEIDSIQTNYAEDKSIWAKIAKNNKFVLLYKFLSFYEDNPEDGGAVEIGSKGKFVVLNSIGVQIYDWEDNIAGGVNVSDDFRYILIKETYSGGEGSVGFYGDMHLIDLKEKEQLLQIDAMKGSGHPECAKCVFENDKFINIYVDGESIKAIIIDPQKKEYYYKFYDPMPSSEEYFKTIERLKKNLGFPSDFIKVSFN
jgi:hypothetical protein